MPTEKKAHEPYGRLVAAQDQQASVHEQQASVPEAPTPAPETPVAAPDPRDAVIAALSARLAALEAALEAALTQQQAPATALADAVAPAAPTPTLHADSGHWPGVATVPKHGDVPGLWLRSPRTGTLSFVPSKHEDTIKRCLSEGYTLEQDPAVSGAAIFGTPTTPKGADMLGQGGTASVSRF